jgi:thiol-disulfide isomerase/thioredoxin
MAEEITSMEEFRSKIDGGGSAVALFYYPYCPFCASFLPEFDRLAGGRPDFFLLRADLLGEIEDRHRVEVVPTVILFNKGKETARLDGRYGRGLNAGQLKEFLSSRGF